VATSTRRQTNAPACALLASMTRSPSPIPVRPAWGERIRASDSLVRAIAAECIRANEKYKSVDDILARHWPNDANARLITRAASNPATIGGAGWADSLRQRASPISSQPWPAHRSVRSYCGAAFNWNLTTPL
jgi:hypothetical protein